MPDNSNPTPNQIVTSQNIESLILQVAIPNLGKTLCLQVATP